MFDLFYRNSRLTILTICLIVVAGLSSFYVLPRMEDPELTQRVALINTILPGADGKLVEAQVTEEIEDKLREVEEIKEIRSTSLSGVSTITVELRDDIYDVGPVWARIRDKVDDAVPFLPEEASDPVFDELEVRAYAMIVALKWTQPGETNYAILRRLGEFLKDELLSLSGTEEVDMFGDPNEEIIVQVDPEKLAARGLTVGDVANRIRASDSKVAAGRLRGDQNDLLFEVKGELESLEQIESIPIREGDGLQAVHVRDVASVRRGVKDPPDSLTIVGGDDAVTLGLLVRSKYRVDLWTQQVQQILDRFRKDLPTGVELDILFEQNQYVEARLDKLLINLLLGGLAVTGVVFLLMGLRNAIIVGISLPLSAFMVLTGMRLLGIPIHQMSVTGLIIALGLLIDNAIVMVDEVTDRLQSGAVPRQAVSQSVRHLLVPLLGSTVTTALAFAPIALMPGPAGEFVGAIAISVILAIFSSLFLAMTIVPTLAAAGVRLMNRDRWHFVRDGFRNDRLAAGYRRSLKFLFARPVLGVLLGMLLPITGFVLASQLPEQFFPPGDRDQIHIELELPAQVSLNKTIDTVRQIRDEALTHPQVEQVHWFLGESAPTFYYNVVAKRKNTPRFAQALIQLKSRDGVSRVIDELQDDLDLAFPGIRTIVRQLEQGPPFDAPVEVRLHGPDLNVLRKLGNDVRYYLSQIPEVVHIRTELNETVPKEMVVVDEEEARMVGLDNMGVARQLEDTLEGALGGSILEETERITVRTRVPNQDRGDKSTIASLDLQPAMPLRDRDHPGIPLSALARSEYVPEIWTIPHLDGQRINEVQAFIKAGVLPDKVLKAFQTQIDQAGFKLPPGYSLDYGGEAAERDNAVGNLMANVGVLLVLMVATLVLSFQSFRAASLIGAVAALSAGLGVGALWVFGYPFGFMAIVGSMGLIGVAINDAIVVLAAVREEEKSRAGEVDAVANVVVRSTRHVVATSLTTMVGFLPLVLGGGGFWPPLAVAIGGGVGGATVLALYFIPSAYILLMCRKGEESVDEQVSAKSDASSSQPVAMSATG